MRRRSLSSFRRPLGDRARPRAFAAVAAVAAVLPALFLATAAADVHLATGVVGAGGGAVAGGGYQIVGTLGQPVVGRSRGAAGQVASGFWAGGVRGGATSIATASATSGPTPTATTLSPTPTPTPTPTVAGGRQWVVTTTDDLDDGACSGAHCSLREALIAADAAAGADRIGFAIPAGDAGCTLGGPCTIRPTTPLREIYDGATTIDGYSQAGARPNTAPVGQALNGVLKIVLDGSLLPGCCPTGVVVRGAGATVRGLVIHDFHIGIRLLDGAGSRIEGNYVGTDALGLAAPGNRCGGVSIEDIAGGDVPRDHRVGGDAAARNLLSGNTCAGLQIGGAIGTRVVGNVIGADASAVRALSNSYSGVYVHGGATGSRIGGEGDGEPNVIAFNELAGVDINGKFGATVGNTLTANQIHANGGPGIALVDGGNHGLAAPVIVEALPTSARGTACALCVVEVFSDAVDEGGRFEGRTRADGAGMWQLTLPGGFGGPFLTATATDAGGDTSAFSAPKAVAGPRPSATPTATAQATATAGPTPTAGPSATPTGRPSGTATGQASPTPTVRPSTTPDPAASTPPPRHRIWLPIASRPPVLEGN